MLCTGDQYLNTLESYFTSLVAVALLSAVVSCFFKEGLQKQILLCMGGILLLLIILRPITKLRPEVLEELLGNFTDERTLHKDYETLYAEKYAQQVKQSTEHFVSQKAQELGAWVNVRVELTQEEFPVPEKIEIYGSLTGDQLAQLKRYVTDSIGIPVENQTWRLYD